MLWLTRWVAMSYNRFQMGKDGKTPYQRQIGRACKAETLPFGEKVLYKRLRRSGERKEGGAQAAAAEVEEAAQK